MKTTHYLRVLMTSAVCFLAAVTASAQFTAKVDQVPRNDWAPETASFGIVEVAQALGTDSASLFNALDAWIEAEASDANMFLYAPPSAPDTWSDNYTTGGEKGFWISEEAEIIAYPDGAYYCNPGWDREAGTFDINIGMMPDALKYGVYNKTLVFGLKLGDKTATFTIDFTVTGGEQVDVPEPATLAESELNVVGEATASVTQLPRTSYDADQVTFEVADILEKLGITADVLTNAMEQLLYATEFDLETVGKKDTLSNNFTAGAPGFWMTDIRVDGQATGECSANAYGGGDAFYAEAFAYDAENGVITCNLGQYPGTLKGGEELFAHFYIIYGDKAYRLRLNLSITIPEQGNGLADYTKVGEGGKSIELEVSDQYLSKPVTIDLAPIAEALGCEVSGLTVKALDDTDNFAASTGERGGFWFNAEGTVVTWSGDGATGNAIFVNPDEEGDFSSVAVGEMPNALTVGQPVTAYLYFFNGPEGDKYYTYAITVNPVEPKTIEGDFENVRAIAVSVQTLVTDDYTCTDTWGIDLAVLESIIGTTDPKLFGLATDAKAEETGSIYSDAYSCTPYPGFWLDADGRVSVYGSAPVGYTYANGVFTFYQLPGSNNVGDVFRTQAYLVNPDNNKMITFNMTVSFVESIEKAEVVGEEDIVIPVSKDGTEITIDLSKAAEALGVSVADLTSDDHAYLRGLCDTGVYGEGRTCFDGLAFDQNGYFNITEGALFFEIDPETLVLSAYAQGIDITDDYVQTAKFAFQIENKQYVFSVKFVSEAAYTAGIGAVAVERGAAAGQVYDLGGRRVARPSAGLYILNGRKYVVK